MLDSSLNCQPVEGSNRSASWLSNISSSDVDAHSANLGRWRLNYEQISCGPFHGEFSEVRLNDIKVLREITNQKIHQHGLVGAGDFGITLPWTSNADLHFNGAHLQPGNVFACFDSEVDMCTPSNFEVRGVVVKAQLIENALAEMSIELPSNFRHQAQKFMTNPSAAVPLRHLLTLMQQTVEETPWILEDEDVRNNLQSNFLSEIVRFVSHLQPSQILPNTIARKRLVQRACETMLTRPDQPMTIFDVCKRVGVSRRTLNYCFQDVLGINPVHYLRSIRLNRVRRELKRCTNERTGVYDVAVKWGFWHFGRFSAEYKRQFSELPSETLRQARTSLHALRNATK